MIRALRDRHAVVTGASSGIGRAIAVALARAGAFVTIVGRYPDRLALVEQESGTGRIEPYQLDLADDDAIADFVSLIRTSPRGLDLLVHSAGVIATAKAEQASVTDLDWQFRINVRAAYILTRAVLPELTSAQGQIVFINSSAGLTARASVGQYAATKHALKAVADSLREENNVRGIRILSVYPGRTASPMQEKLHEIEGKAYYPEELMQPSDVASVVVHALQLPRTSEITDVFMRPMAKPRRP